MVYVEAAVRRRQLVASARSVLMRDGVARTSLRAIAEEASIPLGTLQYVFPSKELLLRAVIEDVVEELAALLKEDVELGSGLEGAIRHGVSA
jgi:AcrR family transcriptional regulator